MNKELTEQEDDRPKPEICYAEEIGEKSNCVFPACHCGLPEQEDDIEQLAKKYLNSLNPKIEGGMSTGQAYRPTQLDILNGVVFGFKAAQSKQKESSERVYTKDLSKVRKLLENICEWSSYKEHPIGKQAQEALNFINSLNKT